MKRYIIYDENGTEDWQMPVNNRKGELVIDDRNVIYSIQSDGKIIAIQGDSQLATTGWPKKSHDNRNTYNWNKH